MRQCFLIRWTLMQFTLSCSVVGVIKFCLWILMLFFSPLPLLYLLLPPTPFWCDHHLWNEWDGYVPSTPQTVPQTYYHFILQKYYNFCESWPIVACYLFWADQQAMWVSARINGMLQKVNVIVPSALKSNLGSFVWPCIPNTVVRISWQYVMV